MAGFATEITAAAFFLGRMIGPDQTAAQAGLLPMLAGSQSRGRILARVGLAA